MCIRDRAQTSQKLGEKVYAQQQAGDSQPEPETETDSQAGDNVVDGEYTEVKDDKK